MVRVGDQMISKPQVPMPPTDTPVFNAQEASGPSIPGPINNPPPLPPSLLSLKLAIYLRLPPLLRLLLLIVSKSILSPPQL